MSNKLNQNFTVISLLKFAAPTAIMFVFMSLYQMVDGVFVSNFVGDAALSALNIIYPIPSIVIAFSIMLATGGNAIIAKNMGEGKHQEAKENFSLIILTGLVLALSFMTICLCFLDPIIRFLGATDHLLNYCHNYLIIFLISTPLAVFQMLFQNFFVTAGKPHIGLVLTITGGITNIVLDYLFIVVFHFGISGAAFATSLGYAIPGIIGLIYFTMNREGSLYFVKPVFRKQVLIKSCTNGSSEMVNNLAVAITTYMFNIMMLKYAGEDGVAAITIVLYAQFLLTSVFMGFSSGITPIISYNYGKQNKQQLHHVFTISLWFVIITSIFVFILSNVASTLIIGVFAQPGSTVFDIAKDGFTIFGISFLFTGMNIFVSALFTAYSDGKVSAIISFLRTFVFLIACLMILPKFIALNGIWLSVPVAEGLSLLVAVYYLITRKKKYSY